MKTTVEISDALLHQARQTAAREGVTLRALIERGLRQVVNGTTPAKPFKLRRASFRGSGLQPEFAEATWERVRDTVYQGRGA